MQAQQIWSVLVFLACIAVLPFIVKRWKATQASRDGSSVDPPPRIVSALAVGPQQRVVTIEVVKEGARVRMILGVTPQHISCLSVEPWNESSQTAKADTIGASPHIVE